MTESFPGRRLARREVAPRGSASPAAVYGRDTVLRTVRRYLDAGHSVLLLGPRDVGKTAIISQIADRDLMVLDPFMGVPTRLAGRIRRAMDRGAQCVAATRTVDRRAMGAVRRLAFRFTTVRVPPLSARWMRRVVEDAYGVHVPEGSPMPDEWRAEVIHLAQGLPGAAVAVVRAAATYRATHGRLPSPRVAYVAARIARVELAHPHDGLGQAPRRLRDIVEPGVAPSSQTD